ncbi:SPFH domain-containing protein [Sphingobacteriales bacterium UPWRP_1]|nr:antifreeze protein [Sphingobacteriales bacterium TSM_CSM]PSJ74598.1 SPFH domain-containing protein [Sphingobacteriales bacterium UPWRP_1]
MGLFDKFSGEFIDIIEWLDPTQDTMVHRFERHNNEIKNNAKLTVRESQVAVFVDQGQIADVFGPGMYTLNTENLPVLSTLRGWKYGFESPFKAEVYFVNTKNFTDCKWGTKNPVIIRDPEFGPMRLRAFGTYTIKVKDAAKFIDEIVGTAGHFTVDEVTEQLRNIIVSRFSDTIAESKIPVLDLAASYDDLSKFVHTKISPEFEAYGLDLTKFLIENVSLPPEVEAALDKRSSMGIIGDLNKYMQYQTAEAMEKAAENPSGGANEGIGLGVGLGMVNQMMQQMKENKGTQENTQNLTPPKLPEPLQLFVAQNGKQTGPFTEAELKPLIEQGALTRQTLVWKAGMNNWAPAETVPELNSLLQSVPPPLPPL